MLLDYIFEHSNEILDIFNRYGYENVYVFGSVARRAESDKSDIDFIADFRRNADGTVNLDEFIMLERELRSYFHRDIELVDSIQIEEHIKVTSTDVYSEAIMLCRTT